MSDFVIITNNKPRDIIGWGDLTANEQKEFDHLDTEEKQKDARFFRYKHQVYCTDDFMAASNAVSGWDGMASDTHFSGVLFRYCSDGEQVITALYRC